MIWDGRSQDRQTHIEKQTILLVINCWCRTSILFSIFSSHPSMEWCTAMFTIWSANFSISEISLSKMEHFSSPSSHSVIKVPAKANKSTLSFDSSFCSLRISAGCQSFTTSNRYHYDFREHHCYHSLVSLTSKNLVTECWSIALQQIVWIP
mgnify:CR=1 FL=1